MVIEKMWGESTSPIIWSVHFMIERGQKNPFQAWHDKARLEPYRFWGYSKADIKFPVQGRLGNAEHCGWDTGFLPTFVTTSFCVPGPYRHRLWCQQLVRQLVSVLASILSCNTRLLRSLIKSFEPIRAFIHWQLTRLYKCESKSFI